MEKVRCKIDYGQFEANKVYEYTLKFKNYLVQGQYGESNFNRNQFNAIFIPIKNSQNNQTTNFNR